MWTCVVPDCNIKYPTKNPENLSFHTCPMNKERREQWYTLIPKANSLSSHSRICSKHFTEDSFQENSEHTRKDNQRKLKYYAVPSLFLGTDTTDVAQQMKLAKCSWLEKALVKKYKKPSILKPKSAKVPQKMTSTSNSAVTDHREQNAGNIITEFQCPVCLKMFRMYFSAYRHIEKLHFNTSEGRHGSQKTAGVIKPTLIEYCLTCNTRVCSDSHKCSVLHHQTQQSSSHFTCLGCEQQFHTLNLFEGHIEKQHNDGAEKYFFPNISDFTLWKQNMEKTTNVKYLALTKREKLQNYYCMHVTSDSSTVSLCPSSIIGERYNKEVHVTFYTQHYGHVCNEYTMPDQFQERSVMEDEEVETSEAANTDEESAERLADARDVSASPKEKTRVNGKRKPAHNVRTEDNTTSNNSMAVQSQTSLDDSYALPEEDTTVNSRRNPAQNVRTEENATSNISMAVQSQTSLDDLYLDIVDENLVLMSERVPKGRRTRKPRLKTKIGFRSINSKSEGVKVNPVKSTFLPTVPVDLKYEVIERDHDCNVLILKV